SNAMVSECKLTMGTDHEFGESGLGWANNGADGAGARVGPDGCAVVSLVEPQRGGGRAVLWTPVRDGGGRGDRIPPRPDPSALEGCLGCLHCGGLGAR